MLRNDSSGYTIVELLVTIIVGSILVGGVVLFISSHTNVAHRGRDIVAANSFAENKIEGLRSAGFLQLSNGTTDITSELPSELKAPRNGSLEISSDTSAIKRAELTITFNDRGTQRTYTYTTLIGELGVGQY